MNFENPVWLYLTPLLVLLIAGLVAFGLRKRDALLRQFAAARLLDQLTEKANLRRILLKAVLILLAITLIGISLARPQYGIDIVERKARVLDIVFVLDSSRSMLATDLRPTRLERARLAIMDLVDKLESDRIGLVVFAGSAFLQVPLTLDYAEFRDNLKSVSPSSVSRGGSNIGQALREAAKAFPKDNEFKAVVLLTDGEDLEEQAIDTAREIAKDGIKVYSIGIGTPQGTYLKVRTEAGAEEFVRDSSGQPVRSQLDEATLQRISQLTGGSYSRLAGQSLEQLYTSVLATLPKEERESEFKETHIDRYQWVLLGAVICLILETLIRRRKKPAQMLIALVLLSPAVPQTSHAEEAIQEAPTEPAETVTSEDSSDDPRAIYNRAHAHLTEGNYAEATDLLKTVIEYSEDTKLERNALYNMAHASNQMGEQALQAQNFEVALDYWKEAEALFKSANELDPADAESLEDAKQMAERRKALEEFLEQQESQESQKNESNSEQNPQDSESESSENNSDESQQSAEDTASETNDSESGDSGSEQEPSENQEESAATQQSSNTKNDASNQASQGGADTESSEGADPESASDDSSADSQENAGDDSQPEDESPVSGEETEQPSETVDNEEMRETSSDAAGSAGGQKAVAIPEGMKLSEAKSLLDSLRNSERLLPFTEPSDNKGQTGNTRNW